MMAKPASIAEEGSATDQPARKQRRKDPVMIDSAYIREKYEKTCHIYKLLQYQGAKLNLPHLTVATAIMYFHKFYSCHTLRDYPHKPEVAAAGCLFLSCKAEGTVRRVRDIIAVCFKIDERREEYPKLREALCDVEVELMRVLDFDFSVQHPYIHLARKLDNEIKTNNVEWKQLAWRLVTDSYNTSICERYSAESIAYAVIHISFRSLELKSLHLPDPKKTSSSPELSPSPNLSQLVPFEPEFQRKILDSLVNFYHFSNNEPLIKILARGTVVQPPPMPMATAAMLGSTSPKLNPGSGLPTPAPLPPPPILSASPSSSSSSLTLTSSSAASFSALTSTTALSPRCGPVANSTTTTPTARSSSVGSITSGSLSTLTTTTTIPPTTITITTSSSDVSVKVVSSKTESTLVSLISEEGCQESNFTGKAPLTTTTSATAAVAAVNAEATKGEGILDWLTKECGGGEQPQQPSSVVLASTAPMTLP